MLLHHKKYMTKYDTQILAYRKDFPQPLSFKTRVQCGFLSIFGCTHMPSWLIQKTSLISFSLPGRSVPWGPGVFLRQFAHVCWSCLYLTRCSTSILHWIVTESFWLCSAGFDRLCTWRVVLESWSLFSVQTFHH